MGLHWTESSQVADRFFNCHVVLYRLEVGSSVAFKAYSFRREYLSKENICQIGTDGCNVKSFFDCGANR